MRSRKRRRRRRRSKRKSRKSSSHQFVLLRHVGTQVEPLDVQLADVLLAAGVSAAQVDRGPLGLLDRLGP